MNDHMNYQELSESELEKDLKHNSHSNFYTEDIIIGGRSFFHGLEPKLNVGDDLYPTDIDAMGEDINRGTDPYDDP